MKHLKLDKTSLIPLHQQLANEIRMAIRSKVFPPGYKLPTEEELCLHFSISRPVVRQAYKQLMSKELIYRHKGKGSFVLKNDIQYSFLNSIATLNEQINHNNMRVGIRELVRQRIECTNNLAEKLELTQHSPIIHIKRVYYGDDIPQFYYEAFLPESIYPGLFENMPSNQAFSTYVKLNHPFRPVQTKRHTKAIILSEDICEHLNLPNGSAGFRFETIEYDQFGRIIELSYTYFKGLGTSMNIKFF